MNVPALRNAVPNRRRCGPLARCLPAIAILALPSFAAGGEATDPRSDEPQPAIAIRPGTADMPTVFTSQIDAQPDGAGIAQEISRRFQADDLGNYAIDVSVIDGVVTLDGFVVDEETRGRAAQIAQQVEGVESIHNRIVTRLRQAAADRRDAVRKETMSKEAAAKDAAGSQTSRRSPPDARDDRGPVTVNVIININVDSGNHYGPPPQRSARDGDRPDRPAGSREAADDRQRSLIEQMMQRFRGGPESRRDAPGSPELREELERRNRETAERVAEMRQRFEQMQREMRERNEQREREFEASRRENEARENEARENEARENEARENEARENEARARERRERETFLEDESRRDREHQEREREELEAPRD